MHQLNLFIRSPIIHSIGTKLILSKKRSSKMNFLLFMLVFIVLKASDIHGGDGKNDTKLFATKHFEIRFKNIFKKCWMELANACPNQTELIMLTMSRRNGFENRKAIRQTWMNDSVPGEVIRFLIADAGEGEAIDVHQKLEEEQAKHGDLLFLHGFIDIYAHLHLKVYGGFEWQQSFCAIDGFYLDDVVYTGILAELANVTLSDQKKHLMWRFNFDDWSGDCEDGEVPMPTAFSVIGTKLSDFEDQYGRLKSLTCKNTY